MYRTETAALVATFSQHFRMLTKLHGLRDGLHSLAQLVCAYAFM